VQRFLSLASLAVIGWLGWLFLQGGGMQQPVNQPGGPRAQHQTVSGGGNQTPGHWLASTGQGAATPNSQQPAHASGQPAQPLNTGPTIRIASFNVEALGNNKAAKPHVMQVLAHIVQLFDVVAIQEIRTSNDYLIPTFVQLINQSGKRYDHVIGPRVGRTTVQEQFCFLFNTARIEVDHQSVYTISDPDDLLHREPLVATFRTRGIDPDEAFTFTLVNTHTDQQDVVNELNALAEVYRVVRRSSRGEDDIILLGTLNTDSRNLHRLGQVPGILPLIDGIATTTRQDRQLDNIIIHQSSTNEYTGRSGVFDVMRHFNLTEQQALEVSDHFPIWAEFSIYERDYAGRVANRRMINR